MAAGQRITPVGQGPQAYPVGAPAHGAKRAGASSKKPTDRKIPDGCRTCDGRGCVGRCKF